MKKILYISAIVCCAITIASLVIVNFQNQDVVEERLPESLIPEVDATYSKVEGFYSKTCISSDEMTLVILVPYDVATVEKLTNLSNDISKAYSQGWELIAVTSSDTGIGEAHFQNILIFRMEDK